MKHILFVCHGNICRSAMAEFIARDMADAAQYQFDSAAVSREETGADMYPPAKRTLKAHGIPFTPRHARQVTKGDYDRFDQILVMDHSNLRNIRRIIPSDPEQKISMLLDRDVADPWYTGDFEATFQDLVTGIRQLLKETGSQSKEAK